MPRRYFSLVPAIMGLVLWCVSSSLLASPSLNSFIQQVWEQHPRIKSAQSALDAAKANKQAASKPIYNPEMDVELERTDVNTMSVGISQSIDWGNKRSAATDIAEAKIRLAQAELKGQRLNLAQEILKGLVDLQVNLLMQELAHKRVKLMEEFVLTAEKRQQAGDIGLQDVALAKVALSQAKMQLANAIAQQAQNEARLQAASGLFSADWPVLGNEPPQIPGHINPDDYLRQLPRLEAMQAQMAAAKSGIRLSKAATKADPSIGVRGGMEGDGALLGLSFSMPLNIRNNFRAQVEVASQEALQIELDLMAESQRAKAHILGAHRRYQLTYKAWQTWKKTGLSSLQDQMDLIQTIWKSGEMSTSDYLIQSKQNVDAQETAVELTAQMWAAWIEWLAASGQIETWVNETE